MNLNIEKYILITTGEECQIDEWINNNAIRVYITNSGQFNPIRGCIRQPIYIETSPDNLIRIR